MSKKFVSPKFSSDIPFVPMNFGDRDSIVGRLMEIIEAVIPEGKQQDATKSLIKQRISEYFTHSFNDAYYSLKDDSSLVGGHWEKYVRAIWDASDPSENVLSVNIAE